MREYLFAPQVVRVAVVVGVVVSILFYEKIQLTTGGAIVPAYLALAFPAPLLVVTTLVAGYLTWVVVHVLVPKKKILFGRRKFEVEVLVGLAIILAFTLLAVRLARVEPVLIGLTGIGFLVPGIIAHDMGRQGPRKTTLALVATTPIIAVFAYAFAGLLRLLDRFPDEQRHVLAGVLGYPRELILVAAAASVILGMVVFAKLGWRSGGFITGAYLALVAPRWPDLVFVCVCAAATYAVVVYGLIPRLLLFGRRKMASMILVSALVTWAAEIAVLHTFHGDYTPWKGLTVVTIMAPALLANDAQRQGWWRTLAGATITGFGVFAVMSAVTAAAHALGYLQ